MKRQLRFRSARDRGAFSLVELLVVMLIVSILGGTVVSVLALVFGMFNQLNDYMAGREEIEFIVQSVGREITNVGLGMPNNRQGKGSFASSFHEDASASNAPIMAQMGAYNENWGGPVTLGKDNPGNLYTSAQMVTTMTTVGGRSFYEGPELYYAWAVPTGVKVALDGAGTDPMKRGGDALPLSVYPYDGARSGLQVLQNFSYDGRNIGIRVNAPAKTSSWIVFPSFRIPVLITAIDAGAAKMTAQVAPYSHPGDLSAPFMGLEEVFLLQAARLYRNAQHELVQLIFEDPATTTEKILAHNIVGLHFAYDPVRRILSMYVAAEGQETGLNVGGVTSSDWPAFAAPLSGSHRFVVERIDWRIRN
ncbi:MAG: type II secretion system GspH family protein [Synergistaceae bacterium]|jgi:hypothetical protein|nr:type II secretion system GspH family protein [Synergistaceae bacterium]